MNCYISPRGKQGSIDDNYAECGLLKELNSSCKRSGVTRRHHQIVRHYNTNLIETVNYFIHAPIRRKDPLQHSKTR